MTPRGRNTGAAPAKKVEANTRPDRILPARVGMIEAKDRRAGRLFTTALHANKTPFGPKGKQLILPGFERAVKGPALPLVLYDLDHPIEPRFVTPKRARQGPGPLPGRPHSRGNPMRILEVQLDDEDLALLEHVRAHLVLDVGAGVTLRGSALAPEEVLRFALHCLADGVGSHHAPTRAQ